MQRTDLQDTSLWAHKKMLEKNRAMTPDERLQLAVQLTDQGWEIFKNAKAQLKKERAEKKVT